MLNRKYLTLLLILLGSAIACEPKREAKPADTGGSTSSQMSAPATKPVQAAPDQSFHPGSSAPKTTAVAPKPSPAPTAVPDPIDLNFKKAE